MNTQMHVFLPTYGGNSLLERTLEFLSQNRLPEKLQTIFVIENGEKYQVAEVVEKFSRSLPLKYIYSPLANKSHALNLALGNIEDESLIVFIDDDIRVSEEFLSTYAKAAREFSPGYFFGGPTGVDYEESPPEWLRDLLPASARGFDFGKEVAEISKPSFLGFNWAAYASDIRQIGGFDEKFGPGSTLCGTGQETMAMKKLLDYGAKAIYLPTAKVWHYIPKERCNESWLMERAYRMGLSHGYRNYPETSRFLPYPKWLLRRRVEYLLKGYYYRLTRGREKSFPFFYEYKFVAGQIEGSKKALSKDAE